MAIPRGKVVKETTRYDDLMERSSKTKKALAKSKTQVTGASPKPTSQRRLKLAVKVHIRSKNAASTFALLIKQSLYSSKRSIEFRGTYNSKSGQVKVATIRGKADTVFIDNRKQKPEKPRKVKGWNTEDFFKRNWVDMPPFENAEKPPFVSFDVSFPTVSDQIAFAELLKQPLSPETKSIQFPANEPKPTQRLVWMGNKKTSQPRYPVFIVTKGRANYGPLTAKALRELGIPFYLMVEPHEYDKYRVLCDWAVDVFVIPESNHGQGPGRARNACWDVAKNILKSKRHWVLDDNIRAFYRLHQNERIRVGDGTIFRAAEDFVDRYTNIPVAGFGYKFFHPANGYQPPFKVNTRIYSTLLIDNNCPYRWRGRYNEDTILSLDVLKDVKKHKTHQELNAVKADGKLKTPKGKRLATVEFVAFLQDKLKTQTQKGGNTQEFYKGEGTAAKSAMLVDVHPDVSKEAVKFKRDHHKVAYEVFRSNWLIRTDKRKAELRARKWKPLKENNPYRMKIIEQS